MHPSGVVCFVFALVRSFVSRVSIIGVRYPSSFALTITCPFVVSWYLISIISIRRMKSFVMFQ